MRAKPSLLQIRRPPSVLQERVRGQHDVRRGRGARGPPGGLQSLQRLRAELHGQGTIGTRSRYHRHFEQQFQFIRISYIQNKKNLSLLLLLLSFDEISKM